MHPHRLSPSGWRLVAPLALALLAGCELDEQPGEQIRVALQARLQGGTLPAPTEHILDEDAEEENEGARAAWIEAMHRAAPGTDWRAVERRNGEAQRAKRNGLAKLAAVASRWTERGSHNQAGNSMSAFPAPDGARLYVGSALGGTWRSPLDGSAWEPLGDNTYGGAAWLAILPGALPTDPDVILRSTDGGLIDVSRDEGATWIPPAGLPGCDGMRRVLVTEDGAHTVFLVAHALDGVIQTKKWGVYRSTDGAQSFQKVDNLGPFPGDLWATRTGATVLYCARNGMLEMSTDKGDHWSDVGAMSASGDAELTGSEAGAPRLWSVLQEGASANLYRSDDAGAHWTFLSTLTDYWGALNASITDAGVFAYGGVELFKTTDGGGSFVKQNGWGDYYGDPANKLHADMMGFDVYPDGAGGEVWYVNTHGGTYRSTDRLASVHNLSLSGLNVSQYYTTLTSVANPLHIVAGAQDQGYQWTDNPPGADGQIDFDQIISGDYGHATSGDGTHAFVYSVYPGFLLVHKGENNPTLITDDFPSGETYGWLPTVVADPDEVKDCFFCASHLYRYAKSTVGINNWVLTQYSSFDFAGSAGEYLTGLAFAPADHQRVYAVTSAGRLFHSSDHGLTWTKGTGSAPDEHYFYGNALVASQLDPDVAYVGGSGYSGPAVRRTLNGGATWAALSDGLPPTLVYSLVEAPGGSIFAGTETAAYRLDPGSSTWVDITSNEAPVTIWWSAEYVASAHAVRFGTYGRGIWDYSLDAPCAYEAYGTGLGGANVITLDSASPTTVGTTHVLDVAGAAPSAAATLIYSSAPLSAPFKGGTLLVSPATWLLLAFATDGAGSASIPLPVPADAALAGLPLQWQVVQAAGGWKLSNGLAGTLCP